MPDRTESKSAKSPSKSSGGDGAARTSKRQNAADASGGQFTEFPTSFGRFQVLRLLGDGGMGSVYLANDPELDKEVALKIPKADLASRPVLWERFQREARAAGDLNHPYICGMYEIGQVGSVHYLSMEYIPGRPLHHYISRKQSQRKVATVVRKLAQGLAYAHGLGIIHRDVKPMNVMIDGQGEPKLMDFGLVRRMDVEDGDNRATQPGVILGSPGYMSPEQALADHDEFGPATDVYGLGVVLFELLTGSLPFNGSVAQVLTHIAAKPPPRPSSLRPDIDTELESLCLRMLAKKPQDRPHSMTEVVTILTNWIQSTSSSSAPSVTSKRAEEGLKVDVSKEGETVVPATVTAEPAETAVEPAVEMIVRELELHKYRVLECVPSEDRGSKLKELLKELTVIRDACDRMHRDVEIAINSTVPALTAGFVDDPGKQPLDRSSTPALLTENRRKSDVTGLLKQVASHWIALTVVIVLAVTLIVCWRAAITVS